MGHEWVTDCGTLQTYPSAVHAPNIWERRTRGVICTISPQIGQSHQPYLLLYNGHI